MVRRPVFFQSYWIASSIACSIVSAWPFAHPASNWRSYPFTRSEVRAKVDRLTEALTEKALTEYRRGEIPAAIADWKTILAYDPGHEESARSIRTATQQLETLKKLPPGK